MTHPLSKSLGDPMWVYANLERLQQVFPENWTPLGLIDAFAIGHQLKALGVDWNGDAELNEVISWLMRLGIMRLGENHARTRMVRRGALLPIPADLPPIGSTLQH